MNDDEILTSEEINQGLKRLTVEQRVTIAPVIGNVENQPEFRKQIQEIDVARVNHLLDEMFPGKDVSIQDLRRSLAARIAQEEEGTDVMEGVMWGDKNVEL